MSLRRRPGERTDEDFAEEVRAHLELEAEQLIVEGAREEEAQSLARRAFGNVPRAQERFHDSRRYRWMEELAQDIDYALRQLRRSPSMAAAIILTLALGVGANAVIFGVVDRLLLRPPPGVEAPEQLRRLYFKGRSPIGPLGNEMYTTPVSPFAVVPAMQRSPAFAGAAGFDHRTFTLGRGADAQRIDGEEVTGNYFELLGARTAIGHFFTAAYDRPPVGAHVVVLSFGFWQRQFAGARDVIGRSIRIDGVVFAVVGVSASGFNGLGLENVDVWMPVSANDRGSQDWVTSPGWVFIQTVARLAPGATTASAAADATVLYRRLVRDWQSKGLENTPDTLSTVIPGSIIAARGANGPTARGPNAMSETRVSLWLAAVAGIVLLVACANVTNLLLARAFRRRREIAVRLALGVGRSRLIRQLLTESCVLASIAAIAALMVSVVGAHVIGALLLPPSTYGSGLIDGRVAAFTALTALAAALLAGTAPALQATKVDVAAWLSTGVRDSGRRSSLQRTLLVAQASLSVLLLIGAGLFVRSLQRVRETDVGIDLAHALLVQSSIDDGEFDSVRTRTIFEKAMSLARHVPGVSRVTLASYSVPKLGSTSMDFAIPGRATLPRLPHGGPYVNVVDDQYFATLGARILQGRGILAEDSLGASHIAVINATLAGHYWPKQSPIGACLTLPRYDGCTEVVGVVQDIMMWGLVNDERSQYYLPRRPSSGFQGAALLARTAGDARVVGAALRQQLQSISPDMPYVGVQSFEELVEPDLRSWKLGATLFTAFGALALVIASVGLYGVLTYAVSQRTREIGVRLALGARRNVIIRQIAREGVSAIAIGIMIGTAMSLALARVVEPMLYRTSPRDPAIICCIAVVLLLIALVASAGPAWRAARVDPNVALREE